MNNGVMTGGTNNTKHTVVSREELIKQYKAIRPFIEEMDLASLDANQVEAAEIENVEERKLEDPAKVKTLVRMRNGFIDALVLAFLTAVAGLTSFLYMLLNINSALY